MFLRSLIFDDLFSNCEILVQKKVTYSDGRGPQPLYMAFLENLAPPK